MKHNQLVMIGGVLVAAILLVGVVMFLNRPADQKAAQDTTPATYQSEEDLDSAAESLDGTDIDASLDSELQELDAQAESF